MAGSSAAAFLTGGEALAGGEVLMGGEEALAGGEETLVGFSVGGEAAAAGCLAEADFLREAWEGGGGKASFETLRCSWASAAVRWLTDMSLLSAAGSGCLASGEAGLEAGLAAGAAGILEAGMLMLRDTTAAEGPAILLRAKVIMLDARSCEAGEGGIGRVRGVQPHQWRGRMFLRWQARAFAMNSCGPRSLAALSSSRRLSSMTAMLLPFSLKGCTAQQLSRAAMSAVIRSLRAGGREVESGRVHG
jgi:hypothetical protein